MAVDPGKVMRSCDAVSPLVSMDAVKFALKKIGTDNQTRGNLRRRNSVPDENNKQDTEGENLDALPELELTSGITLKNCINKNLLSVRRNLNRTASSSKVQYAMIRLAISEDNYPELQTLLRRKDCKVNEIEGDGMASIHFAAMHGTVESIKVLIDEGAKINIPSHAGEYPLDIAVKHGNFEIAQFLIEKGARLDNVIDGTPCEKKKGRYKYRSKTIDTATLENH